MTTTTTIYIHKQRYKLDSADLIQSGGEGMVFGLGDTAVKLYHHPNPTQQKKLQHWFNGNWQSQLPPNVLGPCAPVHNQHGQIIGLQMARLPAHSLPIKRLGMLNFWQKQGLSTTTVLQLLQKLEQTVSHLHQLNLVVGDLNDNNIHFTAAANGVMQPFWIDVDSYQFAHFPCPVAMPTFLDPTLFHVTDFSQRPFFSPLTDWYAFTVLLVKSLLQVHPYGGTQRQYKSLQTRAAAGISILDGSVTYPLRARPLASLSDDLLQHLHRTFDKGERRPFPANLLRQYAQSLQTCSHCQLGYPASRRGCPACRHAIPTPVQPTPSAGLRTLLDVDGFIEAIFVQPNGRLLIIYRQGNKYQLLRAGIGGRLGETTLFNGSTGYRFAAFTQADSHDFLVVNPPHKPQLLLLDIQQAAPQQIALLETAMFKNLAVFSSTPNHLYRISGGWIMRGTVQQNSYLEDAVGTAHKAQTWLAGSPFHNGIAGYHRVFAKQHYFTITPNGRERPLAIPPPAPGTHVAQTALTFAPKQIAIVCQLGKNGRFRNEVQLFDTLGNWQQSWDVAEDSWETAVNQFPFSSPATPFPHPLEKDDRLHHHPKGWLIQQPHRLKFLPI
jgi:serine/threonine protein kinase